MTTARSLIVVTAHGGMPAASSCGGRGIVVEEVAQHVGGDPAVGDHGDRPGRAGQADEEGLQPRPGLPG